MAYILKNTSGLVNTRLTDTGRLKLSEGNFNISYFQIGDSEVSYNTLSNTYNQTRTNILEPNFNSQNSAQGQTNKQNVKYPYYVDGVNGNTYGIPFMASEVSPIYNTAAIRGFFSGNTTLNTWSAITTNLYVINSNYIVDMNSLTGGTKIKIIFSGNNSNMVRLPSKGDFITIYYDGNGKTDYVLAPTPSTPTPTPTPTITPSYDACKLPDPSPTPSSTCCIPTPTGCTPTPAPQYVMPITNCYSMLTYRIVDICLDVITLDRVTPDFSYIASGCSYSRVLVYPPNMTSLYDSVTPLQHWNPDVINFESVCNTDQFDVKVWNMNIPWSENPAGLFDGQNIGFKNFTSSTYLGTKEYLGYMTSSGQTFVDSNKNTITDQTYYIDTFGNKIIVTPEDQKAIAIIHYTNQTIDFFYGEKFAMEPYNTLTPNDTTGDARNFKLHIPWLMWHKSPTCCVGETFYVDPPNDEFEESNLLTPYYIQSTKNSDMNDPGIRYYNLWDTYPSKNNESIPNRVGKVFPDQKIIVIDDDELVAALSYKSNRNWTLPAATTTLITPNTCNTESSNIGVLTNPNESMYVSYLLTNTSSGATNSLHCNYYSNIVGPYNDCNNIGTQNVAVRFNGEFNCLNQITNTPLPTGYLADTFQIICQKVTGNTRPVSSEWRLIDFTSDLTSTNVNGYITQSGLTGNTFIITNDLYNSASNNTYNLNDYIELPTEISNTTLNFGDEYYFYGSLETDIQATIYEMKYKINLGQAEFQVSSNPSWSANTNSYITEIGLYDDNFDLMIVSKLQSPVFRQGIQQFLLRFDF